MLECPLVKHVYVLCGRPLGLQTPLIQAIGCKMKGDSCESNLLTASLAVPTSLEKRPVKTSLHGIEAMPAECKLMTSSYP